MLNKTTAAPENRRPWSWYRVGAPEEHLSGSVLLRSSTRVGAPEEPGSVLLRSWLLRSRVGDSQERPSPTYHSGPMRSPRNRLYGSMSDSPCSLGDSPSSSSSTNEASESNHDVTGGKGVRSLPPLPDSSSFGKSVGLGRWRFCSGCILHSCRSLPASACLSAPSLPSMDTCDGTQKNLYCLEGSLANSSICTQRCARDTPSQSRLSHSSRCLVSPLKQISESVTTAMGIRPVHWRTANRMARTSARPFVCNSGGSRGCAKLLASPSP